MNEFKCLLNSLWLTNKDVAEIWGISPDSVRAWVRGRDPVPDHRIEQLRYWERIRDNLVKSWATSGNIPEMAAKETWQGEQQDLPHPYVWNSAVYFAGRCLKADTSGLPDIATS